MSSEEPAWGPHVCGSCDGWGWVQDRYWNYLPCLKCQGTGVYGKGVKRPAPSWMMEAAVRNGGQWLRKGYTPKYLGPRDERFVPSGCGTSCLSVAIIAVVAIVAVTVTLVVQILNGDADLYSPDSTVFDHVEERRVVSR